MIMSNAIVSFQHGYTHTVFSTVCDTHQGALTVANELNAYLNRMAEVFPVYIRRAVEIVHQPSVFDDPYEQWRVSCRYSIGYVGQAPAGMQYHSSKVYNDDATYAANAFNGLFAKKETKYVNK